MTLTFFYIADVGNNNFFFNSFSLYAFWAIIIFIGFIKLKYWDLKK